MKKVYVIKEVEEKHVQEYGESIPYVFLDKKLCAYAPDEIIKIGSFHEIRRARFLVINNGKENITFAFIPGCEHADFITDSIEKLIRNTQELHHKTDQLNFRIKENTELQISIKKLTDSIEKIKAENIKLQKDLIEHLEFYKGLLLSFWKRLKFLFFPNL